MSSRSIQCSITVRGRVAPHWSPWLGELRLAYRVADGSGIVTDLIGTLADQSALQGVLNRIWKLNLIVLQVRIGADTIGDGEPAGTGR